MTPLFEVLPVATLSASCSGLLLFCAGLFTICLHVWRYWKNADLRAIERAQTLDALSQAVSRAAIPESPLKQELLAALDRGQNSGKLISPEQISQLKALAWVLVRQNSL